MDDSTPGPISELAKRSDIVVGQSKIRPSVRVIEGPDGAVVVEPRVMQLLVALLDANGEVRSRDDLMQQCWHGVLVGGDALNRAISEIRRALRQVGASLSIETIPRIGYRIDTGSDCEGSVRELPQVGGADVGRRKLVLGGIAASALLAGGTLLSLYRSRRGQVDVLIEQGRRAQSLGGQAASRRAEAHFQAAIKIDPERADAWGWLARVSSDPAKGREAALQALSLDAGEPNARCFLIVQRRDLDDWPDWEDELLNLLDDAPDNTLALGTLSYFYQCVGRCMDCWNTGEHLFRLEPLNPDSLHRRAYRHWIFGKIAEADRIADQALRMWPRDPFVWNARLLIYAFTDRAPAALALLEDAQNRPANLKQPSINSWHAALKAIDTRAAADIAKAIEVCTQAAVLAPGLAANAIMAFSSLGQLDAAYRVADGLFSARGDVIQRSRGKGIRDVYSDAAWAKTPFWFIPATTAFRADNRFADLCERTGHIAYWHKRRTWPDPFVRGSLKPI